VAKTTIRFHGTDQLCQFLTAEANRIQGQTNAKICVKETLIVIEDGRSSQAVLQMVQVMRLAQIRVGAITDAPSPLESTLVATQIQISADLSVDIKDRLQRSARRINLMTSTPISFRDDGRSLYFIVSDTRYGRATHRLIQMLLSRHIMIGSITSVS